MHNISLKIIDISGVIAEKGAMAFPLDGEIAGTHW
jgi:hypothetical protein